MKDLLGSNDKIYPATPTYNSFLIAKIESLVIRKLNHFDEQYIKTGNLWEYQDVSSQEQQSMRDTWGGMSLSAGSLAEKCMRLNNSSLLELWSNFGNVSHNIAALEKREKSWFTSLPKAHPEPSRYLTRREVNLAGAKKHKPLWVLGVWQRTDHRQNKSSSSVQCMLIALSPRKLGGCNGINQLRTFLFFLTLDFYIALGRAFILPFCDCPVKAKVI